MAKRNIEIKCRLSHEEAAVLNERVRKSGLTREAYLRQLINGLVPTDAPPPDFFAMMKQLYYIGHNLNQIAQRAHIFKEIDAERYDENIAALNKAVTDIMNAVMLPRKMQ